MPRVPRSSVPPGRAGPRARTDAGDHATAPLRRASIVSTVAPPRRPQAAPPAPARSTDCDRRSRHRRRAFACSAGRSSRAIWGSARPGAGAAVVRARPAPAGIGARRHPPSQPDAGRPHRPRLRQLRRRGRRAAPPGRHAALPAGGRRRGGGPAVLAPLGHRPDRHGARRAGPTWSPATWCRAARP